MADYLVTDTQLTGIANSIRAKTGGTDALYFPSDFSSQISIIVTPTDLGLTKRTATENKTVTTESVNSMGYYNIQWTFSLSYTPVGNIFVSTLTPGMESGLSIRTSTYQKNGNTVTVSETYQNITSKSITVKGTKSKTITYYTE